MKRGAETITTPNERKKQKIQHNTEMSFVSNQLDSAFAQIAAEELEIIFSELDFDFKDLYRASQVCHLWHEQLQHYARGVINQYFPYLEQNAPECYQSRPLQLALSEFFFIKEIFPTIELKLILAGLRADKATINSITNDTLKATLIGIMLSNNHPLDNIDEKHRSKVCDVGFKLSANNKNLDLMKKFQALKGSEIATAPAAFEIVARQDNYKIAPYLCQFALSDVEIDSAVAMALLYENFDMAIYIQRSYLQCIDSNRMLKAAVKADDFVVMKIIFKNFAVSSSCVLAQLFETRDVEIFKLLLSQYLELTKSNATVSLFPSLALRSVWNIGAPSEPHSIWNIVNSLYYGNSSNLLNCHLFYKNSEIVKYYLSLYDPSAWDACLARLCKADALETAVKLMDAEIVKCLLEDQYIPLTIESLEGSFVTVDLMLIKYRNNTKLSEALEIKKLIQKHLNQIMRLAPSLTWMNTLYSTASTAQRLLTNLSNAPTVSDEYYLRF